MFKVCVWHVIANRKYSTPSTFGAVRCVCMEAVTTLMKMLITDDIFCLFVVAAVAMQPCRAVVNKSGREPAVAVIYGCDC